MKKNNNTLKTALLLMTLFNFACVPEQEDTCKTKDGVTTVTDASSTSATLDNQDSCSDTTGGTQQDGGVVVTPEPSPNPVPVPDPVPAPAPAPEQTETDATSLNQPWKREDTTIVIDAYEGNSIDWDKMATDPKMAAVIHRSSIGLRVDTKYQSRRKIAQERGYLWGAYHLGRRGDTIKQADLFLSLVGDDPDTLMILDLEDTGSSSFMSIEEAVVFMDYIYEKTGRIPVVYANHSTTKKLNDQQKSNILLPQAKFWYARFRSNIPDFPKGIWSNYFLWQFSSEINCSRTGSCLYNVPGTRASMDINVFNGPESELRLAWNND